MRIRRFFKGLAYKFQYQRARLVDTSLCGIPLKTTRGTIRKTVDQDDAWFFHLSKHHNSIFDIGCNVGYTALLALIQDPEKFYLLVDPNPSALNEAQLNLISNNLGFRAHYYLGFVSDSSHKRVTFYTIGAGAAGSMYTTHATSAAAINSHIEVNTITLDYLYKFYTIKPDLIKIDVEGAETQVMEGACLVAKEMQCAFFIEMHTVKDLGMEKAGQFMLDWCAKMHYKAWYLKTGKELIKAETIKDRGKCHLLLLPETTAYPTYLINIKQNAPLPNTLIDAI
ncbi:FkbM family methyltransferase [Confluentibacter flavum]|uniref:Methyltransferase FkbM domain-containing protein n=1 Tax=Confluentibacter flavum TaxID=1909700 RepID=A0A2N3HP87_9FLAO|nr:FkbM family methyltransferase [Confluentibacter flavum]PKQ46741.1 hypothetical protein CSW08_01710 [Confluentibacter flavum]